jgi:hypothetical protein
MLLRENQFVSFVAPTASFSKGRAEREVVEWSNYKGRARDLIALNAD